MILSQLLARLDYRTSASPEQLETLEVTSVTDDSRSVVPGSLFVALQGVHVDGNSFIPKAVEAGARVCVVQQLPAEQLPGVLYIEVASAAEALGLLSAAWHGYPAEQLQVIGVTGTNGKTTIATLLWRLFRSLGYKAGLLSTVCNYIDAEAVPSTHTTPSAPQLQALLARMLAAGCTHVFMEVSSHAMAQRRVAGIPFRGGIFTNLTRDHLDYHGSVQEYLKAKKSFFDGLPKGAFALSNADDKNGFVMLQNTAATRYSYALRAAADYRTRILESYPYGTLIELEGQELLVQLVGEFNVYNILAVYAAARLLGLERSEVLVALSQLTAVDGRFQTLLSPRGYIAVVDYAHTPDALLNVLETIEELRPKGARILCVVGCGGDRDKGKRPQMAQVAAQHSDRLILTSDNPRSEDPLAILADMKAGLSPDELAHTLVIADRAEAIRTATMLAEPQDMILVAGKGHETYQEIAGVRHHFDDREILQAQFATEA